MRRKISKTLFIVVFVLSLFSEGANATETYDPVQTALALNYCQMSLCRMVTYNDKVVLDQEYENIINNINLKQVEDREIMQLFLSLMDSLTKSKLIEGDRKWLKKEYEKKVEDAVYSSFSQGAGNIAGAATSLVMQDYAGAATQLSQVGIQYFSYKKIVEENKEKLEKQEWNLEKETLDFLNYQRKKILKTSWELIHKYDLPDKWRLTEKQVNLYVEILKDENTERKFRKLERLKDEFQAYPPYWFYLGKTAQELKKNDIAIESYNKFEELYKGIFRTDPFYSSMCINKITLLDPEAQKNEIVRLLGVLENQGKYDNNIILFTALNYMKVQDFESAAKLFQKNIDEEYKISLNKRLLGEALLYQRYSNDLDTLIDEMLTNDAVKNQDILYLIGRTRQIDKIKKIKDQILKIEMSVDSSLMSTDNLVLKLPVKWFFEDLTLSLNYDGKVFYPDSIESDEVEQSVYCTFEDVLEEDEYIESKNEKTIVLNLTHPSNPIQLVYKAKIKERNKDTLGKIATESEYVPNWMKNRIKKHGMDKEKKKAFLTFPLQKILAAREEFVVKDNEIVENNVYSRK
jgi:hypothetical protein